MYYVQYNEGVCKGRNADGDPIYLDWVVIYKRWGMKDHVEFHEIDHTPGRMYNLASTLEGLGWRLASEVEYFPHGPGTGTSRADVERI